MRKFQTIYLDCDGVLKDFHGAALSAHGRPEINRLNWPTPGKNLMDVLSLNNDEEGHTAFWKPITSLPTFWTEAKPFDWLHELIDLCRSVTGPLGVVVLTGPASGTVEEERGKMAWLAKYGVNLEVRFERHKQKLAAPGRLLIDDWERQVDAFAEAGGESLLFPQPWNRAYEQAADPLKVVKSFLLGENEDESRVLPQL